MELLVDNKKARFNYEILEKYVAGIELLGFEVKALKNHRGSLEGSFIAIRGGEAYLINANIPPYQLGNTSEKYDPYQNRRLLLKKSEIKELAVKEATKGLTIAPLAVYNADGKIKVQIAIVKGKKKFDKRETIKKRDTDRELRRDLKDH